MELVAFARARESERDKKQPPERSVLELLLTSLCSSPDPRHSYLWQVAAKLDDAVAEEGLFAFFAHTNCVDTNREPHDS